MSSEGELEDWRKKDGKVIPGESSYVKSLIGAGALSLIGFPVSVGILYPAAAIYHG